MSNLSKKSPISLMWELYAPSRGLLAVYGRCPISKALQGSKNFFKKGEACSRGAKGS